MEAHLIGAFLVDPETEIRLLPLHAIDADGPGAQFRTIGNGEAKGDGLPHEGTKLVELAAMFLHLRLDGLLGDIGLIILKGDGLGGAKGGEAEDKGQSDAKVSHDCTPLFANRRDVPSIDEA